MRYAGLSTLRGLPPLRALIRGIRGDRDVALFRQALGIQARDLFLHPAVRVRHDDRRIFLLRIVVRRGVDVGGDIQAVELVRDRVNIDLARLVLRDRAGVDQRERILHVTSPAGRGDRTRRLGHETRPEVDGVSEPSLRARADSRAEAVPDVRISTELRRRPCCAERRDAPRHDRRRSDRIILTDDDERRRLALRGAFVARVRHDDRRRLRELVAAEARDAMRPDGGCHPRAGRAAPQRIAPAIDPQRVGVPHDERERRCQVLGCGRTTKSRAILQDEGVVAGIADRRCIREPLVHGADVGEAATGRDDSKGRACLAAEEEEACVPSGWITSLLLLRVEGIEHLLPRADVIDDAIQPIDDHPGLHVAVVREQRVDLRERHLVVVAAIVPGQQQAGVPLKRRVLQQVSDPVLRSEVEVGPRFPRTSRAGGEEREHGSPGRPHGYCHRPRDFNAMRARYARPPVAETGMICMRCLENLHDRLLPSPLQLVSPSTFRGRPRRTP